jgi:hypothetical protein
MTGDKAPSGTAMFRYYVTPLPQRPYDGVDGRLVWENT